MTTEPRTHLAPSPAITSLVGPRAAAVTPRVITPTVSHAAVTLDIGVDLDGVVYDFVSALRTWVHQTTGRALATMPAPTCWNFFEVDWGMSVDEFVEHINDGVNTGYIFRVGEPMPGVVDSINTLLAAGHRIHIVTDRARSGRPGMAEKNTRANLAEHGVQFTSLTLSKDKTARRTDVFIDDRPENYLDLVEAGVDTYLRAYPYNAHLDVPAGRRVDSFADFANSVLARSRAA